MWLKDYGQQNGQQNATSTILCTALAKITTRGALRQVMRITVQQAKQPTFQADKLFLTKISQIYTHFMIVRVICLHSNTT